MWRVLVFLCVKCVLLGGQRASASTSNSKEDSNEPLYLTPLLENNQVAEAQQQSRVKPDIGNTTSYSGYFTVNKACESNLFFWFFPAQNNWREAPLILFLNGGPGAASIYSLFEEVGPLTYKDNLGRRQYSWNVENNLIFIDQPVGTGYSFTGKNCYAQNETVVRKELYSAVVQFHQLFPQLRNNKFYIAGYSYAGHFIPELGYTIHKNNPLAKVKINLVGMLIGNGYMDALLQNDMGSNLYQLGLVDDKGREAYYDRQEKFKQYIENRDYERALQIRGEMVSTLYTTYVGNINIFNYLQNTSLIPTPYETFIQTPRIRKAIHVGNTSYSFINEKVESSLGVAPVLSVKPWVEELLEHYFIVFYNGQLDLICAYPALLNFTRALNWSGKNAYRNATRNKWCVGDDQAGYFKGAHNLYDVMVRNAGHFVPIDQPLWAYILANTVASGSKANPLQGLTACNKL